MSADSVAQGYVDGDLPKDLEDPARCWCDLVVACNLPKNSMEKNDAIKAILVEATKSEWTHQLLDFFEAQEAEEDVEWGYEHEAPSILAGLMSSPTEVKWRPSQPLTESGDWHALDCECEKCFKSRAKYYGGKGEQKGREMKEDQD